MHVEWKIVTSNPQVTRTLKEFAKMCCACNTSLKLALRTSVIAVTLLVNIFNVLCYICILYYILYAHIYRWSGVHVLSGSIETMPKDYCLLDILHILFVCLHLLSIAIATVFMMNKDEI